MTEWIKLDTTQDWGNHYYRVASFDADTDTNKDDQKVLHAFDQIEIRWPDGVQEVVNVTTRSWNEKVQDMGHVYDVYNTLPVVVVDHHGIKITVDFDRIEIARRCLTGPGLKYLDDPDDDPDDGERAVA